MSLPGSYVRDFLEVVEERGVSTDSLLAGITLDVESLRLPTTRVPVALCEAVLARVVKQLDESELAIAVGRKLRISSHGFLGFAAMTAETTREALELVVRFASTRSNAIELALYVDGPNAAIVLRERITLPPHIQRMLVTALFVEIAITAQMLTGATGHCFIECAFPAAGPVAELPDFIEMRFDAPTHRLVFPARLLDIPLTSADPAASRLAREQCEHELARLDQGGIATRVRALLSGDGGTASLDDVAHALKMSPRTLKRKLAESGHMFSQLRDEVRRQRALLLLDNPELSIGEIAQALGYTELANFTRAFRKWTGSTPHGYRRRSGTA